jgi:hypothetical protein
LGEEKGVSVKAIKDTGAKLSSIVKDSPYWENNMTSWANYPPYWAKTGTLNLIGNILVIIDPIGNFPF